MSEVAAESNGESVMEAVTNGGGEEGDKSIMAMIAAGDFDAEGEAGKDDQAVKEIAQKALAELAVKTEEPAPVVEDVAATPAAALPVEAVVVKSEDIKKEEENVKKEVDNVKKEEESVKKEEDDTKEEDTRASVAPEEIEASDDKYKKEDAPRRVLVKHIDRKKTSDEVEDYFFDNYSDCGLEDVYTCMVFNKNSNKKIFFGNVILTFSTVEKAKVFQEMKLVKEETVTWKRKLVRHGLEEVQKRREERAASVVEERKARAATPAKAKVAETKAVVLGVQEPKSMKIACLNFPTTYDSAMEVERYMRECHENVKEVRRQGPKVIVTFKNQIAADRFIGLAYVKFKNCYIGRSYHKEEPRPVERKAEKRKADSWSNNRNTPSTDGDKKSVQFKLKGNFTDGANYRDVKAVLENEHGLDVRFVSLAGGEARVRLLAGSDTAAEVVYRLARDQVKLKGQVLIPAALTREEEAAPIRAKASGPGKAKRERLPDWSDY